MIWDWKIRIARSDWMEHWHPENTLRLFREGKLPEAIQGQMLVVEMKHGLRCIFGSDIKAAWMLLLIALHSRLEDYVVEPSTRAWGCMKFWIAWVGWKVALCFRRLRHIPYPGMWGRHESPEPIHCDCGWGGMRRWAIHTYQGYPVNDEGDEDVEPTDQCPRCGAEI